jgi:hypothetical protein
MGFLLSVGGWLYILYAVCMGGRPAAVSCAPVVAFEIKFVFFDETF